ncbi:hypothetical protein GCM10010211_84100 [Streptomyces albospinus]|uniref:Uncharacterized protein n=1 Tax=Streptomyces albospinus TaxID=285515 RepID=A0ABQ2VPV1_9ACTN|nr:hypothetical protein GCM10010211_84100 [Streptomyces albospinus]
MDDALLEQDVKPAGYAAGCGIRHCGEVDETGPTVSGERVEDLLVLGAEVYRVVSDDRRLREWGAVAPEHGFLFRDSAPWSAAR